MEDNKNIVTNEDLELEAFLNALDKEADKVEIPESLKPENLDTILDKAEEKKLKNSTADNAPISFIDYLKKRKVAAAAVLVLLGTGLYGLSNDQSLFLNSTDSGSSNSDISVASAEDNTSEAVPVYDGQSEAVLSDASDLGLLYVKASSYDDVYDSLYQPDRYMYTQKDAAMLETEAIAATAAPINSENDFAVSEEAAESDSLMGAVSNDSSSAYSTTNLRSAGVDESDIVKTNGKNIFVCNPYDNQIKILDINSDKTMPVLINTLSDDDKEILVNSTEMYVDDNQLILVQNVTEKTSLDEMPVHTDEEIAVDRVYCYAFNPGRCKTKVLVYDVTNPTSPVLNSTLTQDGYYDTSRKVGNMLYLFTNYYPDDFTIETLPDNMPKAGDTVCSFENTYLPVGRTSYDGIYVTAADLSNNCQITDQKYILHTGTMKYVTKDSIFLYSTDYRESGSITDIARFDITGDRIVANCAGSVKGCINNDFAIQQSGDYLYVLSTEFNDIISNSIYVLDSNLNITGQINDIAPGESVKSARFFDEIGYFVTYENTDPLFTVDFKDKSNPKLIGQLNIPGFSEYLHPWGENMLLGIGREIVPDTQEFLGLKISLYDISDPSDVKEVEKYILDADSSPAEYNYKAVLADYDKNVIAFCTEKYDTATDYTTGNYVNVFKVEESTIKALNQALLNANKNDYYYAGNYRNIYIDQYLYTVSGNSTLVIDMENAFNTVNKTSY